MFDVRFGRIMLALFCMFLLVISGCTAEDVIPAQPVGKDQESVIRMGFSMGSTVQERWQRDRDIFVARAKELGAEVLVQNANNDNEEQMRQVRYLIEQGIDILVIIPHDAEASAESVRMAKKAGIKVIAYDRLIRNAGADLYISFDNVKVGEYKAKALLERVPKGNYVIIRGAPTDYNSVMLYQGYMNVLQEPLNYGDIRIVTEEPAHDWAYEEAFSCVEQTLEQGVEIHAIIAANDTLAYAAIEALSEKRLAGKVPVVGQDADLSACQRVVEGTQLMTVYKPIDKIAKAAAEAAVKMVKGEKLNTDETIFDGTYQVPYLKIEPIPVTMDNMMDTIVKDSFHRLEDIFINVPRDQWPSID
ncbi:MAG: substrate-binding domain-containing protein [Bacillota bacterium]|nr:substrate-binding domain-containing protein [Bacillota bacterium]